MQAKAFDSLLVVSFGGPEGPDDVMPFLNNVLRGKNVPEARKLEVAEHYYHFDGVSPINAQARALIAALEQAFAERGIDLPIYWGNRNWQPFVADALKDMQRDGKQHALAFFTSGYSSYSGCRQYRENILDAQSNIGDGAPTVQKVRHFFNHPLFIEANVDHLNQALHKLSTPHDDTAICFTAHSIPESMAACCDYALQLNEACRLVMQEADCTLKYDLVYQSRSGPPAMPWLEPDILDHIKALHADGIKKLVILPIGFLSDHMEVMFDLDIEAKDLCEELGIELVRASTVGVHPSFISMICELVLERTQGHEKRAIGALPPWHDVCPEDCCPRPQRPKR